MIHQREKKMYASDITIFLRETLFIDFSLSNK